MGEIVAAMATCHAPQLFTYPPDEDHAQLDASIAGMRELGKLLDETKPDVIIFLGSDHLETIVHPSTRRICRGNGAGASGRPVFSGSCDGVLRSY